MRKGKIKKYPLRLNGTVWFTLEEDCDEAETDPVIFRSEKEIGFESFYLAALFVTN